MLNFGASKPTVRGGPGPPLDPHLKPTVLEVCAYFWSRRIF